MGSCGPSLAVFRSGSHGPSLAFRVCWVRTWLFRGGPLSGFFGPSLAVSWNPHPRYAPEAPKAFR
eukprot:11519691-Karenia_brevis.AAC.1